MAVGVETSAVPESAGGPLRIGLVGTGAISQFHLFAFRDFPNIVELAAVCDVREEAARESAASVAGDVAVYTDFDRMLSDGGLDAVDLCTPHHLHAPHTIAAAEAGLHVLVEKPMACSVDECRAMVAAADAAGVTLMVAQYLRYLPGSRGIRKLLDDGVLGTPWWARADDWFPLLGPDHQWAYDAKLAGGGVLHMGGTHHIDLFRYFFGDIGAVRAQTWTDNPLFRNGAEDRAVVTLEFENGVVAQLSACYVPHSMPHRHQYMVAGDRGAIYTTLPEGPEPLLTSLFQHQAPGLVSTVGTDAFSPVPPIGDGISGGPPPDYEPMPPFALPYVTEVLHFATCTGEGTEPISSGRDNLESMKAVYGCYESARRGREVQLSDL